jgi:TolB-like protein/DNA-binding SARP family transcriptional activator/Flp pilus assembly protein TadD
MQQTSSEGLKVSLLLLGRFGLRLDSGERVSVSSKKGIALLAYVAMQPEYVASRERLATLLWGDRSDKLARHNLRQCLLSLRRELSPAVATLLRLEDGSVGLNAQALSVDAREFAALATTEAPSALARACELYLGPFLSGVGVQSEEFDEWVRAERARLEASASHVFMRCAEQADLAGQGARAIGTIERLIAIDPLREDWQRLALRIYARHHGRDAALVQADRLAALLKVELGVDVEPATAALIDEIRSRDMAPTAPIVVPDAAGSDVAGDDDRPDTAGPTATAPARRFSNLTAAMATALVLFVAGAWIITQSPLIPGPARYELSAPSRSDRPATGPSWNSPIPRTASAADASALAARGITAIMVWPFTGFSGGDDADQHLADAITDDVIDNLSRFPELRVISRMTAFSYRGRNADAAEIGSDLGVRYIVEGSVRSLGTGLRVNVELVDAATRLQVWGDHFERDEVQRSTVQDEIVSRVARELEVGVASARSQRAAHEDAGEPEVADLIAKGLMAQYRGAQAETLNEARGYYQAALDRDPDLVPALVGVAVPDIMGSINLVYDSGPSLKRAATFLDRAEKHDPDSPLVNYWIGMIRKARGQYRGALYSLYRALELNPSYTPAYAQTASVLTLMGRAPEAMSPVAYAMRLSPNDPTMSVWTLVAGMAELENGHDSAALEWLRRSAELAPNNPNTHRCLAATYALLGDKANAIKQVAEFKRLSAQAATQRTRDQKFMASGEGTLRRLFQGLRIALALAS